MPRLLKNFKIRPAKFLNAHHLKYQGTGTYTGQYSGPPISERRLDFARRVRSRPWLATPLLEDIVGSPVYKGVSNESLSAIQHDCVFLFRHTRTKQVVYSLTGHLDPEYALPQLTFYGKKTVPEKYRKDDWRPYAAVKFDSRVQALHCYWYLRDLRMLRDYAWREKGSSAPPKEIRKKRTMNQSASSICDLSTAIDKLSNPLIADKLDLLAEWKLVEDLAEEAQNGALKVLKKQISRGQRILNTRKKNKKFPGMASRIMLQNEMRSWYNKQTMMYKAVAFVLQIRQTEQHIAHVVSGGRPAAFLELEKQLAKDTSTNSGDSAKEATRSLLHPSFTTAYNVSVRKNLGNLRNEILLLTYRRRLRELLPTTYKGPKLDTLADEVDSLNTVSAPSPADQAVMALREDVSELIWQLKRGANTDRAPELSMTIVWADIEDRKYVDQWPENLLHTSMGPRSGRLQYFTPDLSRVEDDAVNMGETVFTGNDDIDKNVQILDERRTALRNARPDPWDKLTIDQKSEDDEANHVIKEHYWQFLDVAALAAPHHSNELSRQPPKRALLRSIADTASQEVRA